MYRTVSRPGPAAQALAALLAVTITATPAVAAVKTVTVLADGTFSPKVVSIASGDTVEWVGLRRTDAVARLSSSTLAPGGVLGAVDTAEVCSHVSPDDPAFVAPVHAYRQAYEALNDNELTGPGRRGVSGIWALGPEGNGTSKLEIPSAEADAIHPGITVADGCAALTPPDVLIGADLYRYHYATTELTTGDDDSEVPLANPAVELATGVEHLLCSASTERCDAAGSSCATIEPDPAIPASIAPGVYYNGLLTSTYANPDVTGVVLRFNWKDLQYDTGGVISERWQHLDRELERAIAHGKLVTLDVRAGRFGTPDWIFSDWLRADPTDQDDAHAAPWCAGPGPCSYGVGAAPPGAGAVEDLIFLDHYNEDPPGDGCGEEVRIGSPADGHYRDLYAGFMARLAGHLAIDTRWWQTVAHIKVSGANLQTSEAELPHHCDDLYSNTGDHQNDPKGAAFASADGDRILDVFKSLTGPIHRTVSCECNPKLWLDHGYVPQLLYDYYALVEQQLVASTFGEKSLGYQVIQAGFPRADAATGHFYGDHLYQETLVPEAAPPAHRLATCGDVTPQFPEQCDDGNLDETDGCRSDCTLTYDVNEGFELRDACAVPSVGGSGAPLVFENRVNGSEEYCASDTTSDPASPHVFLALTPIDPAAANITTFDAEDTTAQDLGELVPGRRYPGGVEQAEEVMDQAGDGHFTAPLTVGSVDRVAGKLFVPQHSGLQPLPQEKADLGFTTPPIVPLLACDQQLATRDSTEPTATQPAWPAAVTALVGRYVADYPVAPAATSSNSGGCPNPYIVDRGKDRDHAAYTPYPNQPWFTYDIDYPPQLTGFQTNNGVIGPAHVESTLMNLVYNSNAVFIELYETAIWNLGRTRGTGPSAIALDDPAAPERLATAACAGVDCALAATGTTCTCYTKNLAAWAEELHLRRATAAAHASTFLGDRFRGFDNPFPLSYRQRFVNTTGANQYHAYIDPSHCDPALVDLTAGNGVPGALGLVEVRP
jgi:cysteine-rich repeat protein